MKRWFKRLIRSLAGPTKSVRSRVHFSALGDAARKRGDWGTASRYYALHLQENAEDFGIWVQLGHSLKEQGLLDQADMAYGQGNRLNENEAELWLHRAHLCKQRQDFDAACDYFKRSYALEANPDVARELNTLEDMVRGRHQSSVEARNAIPVMRSMDIYNGAMVDLRMPGQTSTDALSDTSGKLRALEDENDRLKKLLATSVLDAAAMKGLVGQT